MKILYIIVRVLVGLMFLFASVSWAAMQLNLIPPPKQAMNEATKAFMAGATAVVYLMPFVKLVEFICGVLFVTGRFVPLATVMIFPIILNIVGFHAYTSPDQLATGIILLVANLYLAYACRKHYTGLLAAKTDL